MEQEERGWWREEGGEIKIRKVGGGGRKVGGRCVRRTIRTPHY